MTNNEALMQNKKALAKSVCKALEERGFKAHLAQNAKEAFNTVLSMIEADKSVAIPGTVTVRDMGLPEALAKKGCRVIDQTKPDKEYKNRKELLLEEIGADWFLTSTNALTYDGVLVNIDGTGNRVAGMCWGAGKIIYVAGINKLAKDVHAALDRVHNCATPPNALRLNMNTPCAVTGVCAKCKSPDRLCRVTTILEYPTRGRETHVILVCDELGY